MSNSMELAIALHQSPRLSRRVQEIGVPADVLDVIRIASGDIDQLGRAQEETGLDPGTLKEAAVLYVQQALFFDGADSYRTLGLESNAPQEQLKEHHRWLIHWLHPDRCGDNEFGVFAERVNKAWNELRTPARREQYDLQLASIRRVPENVSVQAAIPVVRHAWKGDRFSSSAFTTSGQKVRLVVVIVLAFCGLVALVRWVETSDDRLEQQQALAEMTKSTAAPEARLEKDVKDPPAPVQESAQKQPPRENDPGSQDAIISAATRSAIAVEPPAQKNFVNVEAGHSLAGDPRHAEDQMHKDGADATAVSDKEANVAMNVVTPARSTGGVATYVVPPAHLAADVKKSVAQVGATQAGSTPRALPTLQTSGSREGEAAPAAGNPTADFESEAFPSRSSQRAPAPASIQEVAGLERASTPPSIDEAKAILKQLAGAYRAGNLAALMLLFVEEPQGMSRAAIYKQYKDLFSDSRERTLSVQIAGWITERNTLVALGQYQTQSFSQSRNQPRTETGVVRIEMRTENGQVRIVRLAHSQSKS